MKILAIRGENLASLQKFDISLYAGPLERAGLFSITGPTGAGKSAILDALCLALYARIPRIAHEKSAYEIGGDKDRLGVNDPRTVMRRGAVEAFAEVDFARGDARWRARWSVRRANKKPDGKIQLETMTLVDLNANQNVSDHRTRETLKKIETAVGLTYEQFCRSVLLAQGDFALFLKCGRDERAELLERMTGADIYARLSTLAYKRAKDETDALRNLKQRAEAYQFLSTERRVELEEERRRSAAELGDAKAERARLQAVIDWHKADADFAAQLEAASADLRNQQEIFLNAESARAEVRAIELARALRPTLAAETETELRARESVETLRSAETRLRNLEARDDDDADKLRHAQEAFDAAERNRETRMPEVRRAQDLDIRLEEAGARLQTAQKEAHEAADIHAAAVREADSLERESVRWRRVAEEAQVWIDANAHLETLAAHWETRWRPDLLECVRLKKSLAAAEENVTLREREILNHQERVATLRTQVSTARACAAAFKNALEADEAAIASFEKDFSVATLRARRDDAQERLAGVQELRRLHEQAISCRESRRRAADAVQTESAQLESVRRLADVLNREKSDANARLEDSRRDLAIAQATEELAARRPELLRLGAPCPLCGSAEHPFADIVVHPGALVASLRREVDDLTRQVFDLERREKETAQMETKHATLVETERAALAEADRESHRIAETWRNVVRSLRAADADDFPEHPLSDASASVVQRIHDALRAEIAAFAKQEADFERLRRKRDETRKTFEQAVEEAAHAERRLHEEEKTLTKAESDVKSRRRDKERDQAELENIADRLAATFSQIADCRAAILADPSAFGVSCKTQSEEWREKSALRDQAKSAWREAEIQLQIVRERASGLERVRIDKETSRRECDVSYGKLRTERARTLDGRDAGAVVAEIDDAVAQTKRTRDALRDAVSKHESELAATRGTFVAASDAAKRAKRAWDDARLALETAARDAHFDTPEDARRLSLISDAAYDEKRRRVDEIQAGLARAQVVRDERAARLQAHRASGAPELSLEDARRRHADAEARSDELSQRVGAIEESLRADDDSRRRAATVEREVERQRKTADTWARLNDVIGSADGRKFRIFAQSLTLETLLELTNLRLETLRPRYRLERVPGQDMEMQIVDREMGDEVRSCATLSGGETFLVSLALALGLAELSARTATIESLFIDEGFGTLDPDSLEIAVSALDHLQAEGRKIGIISHIPDLAERIGYQVAVTPHGGGYSSVSVIGV
jgi:exonuclease SbcC